MHRETAHTAFQYPFALNGEDCKAAARLGEGICLKAIGELSDVAGNHARSYYEMAPASIVVRLTPQLVAGYQTYGFTVDGKFPEVIDGILHEAPDYPGNEFYIGGKIVKDMPEGQSKKLSERGIILDRDPRRLLDTVSAKFLGGEYAGSIRGGSVRGLPHIHCWMVSANRDVFDAVCGLWTVAQLGRDRDEVAEEDERHPGNVPTTVIRPGLPSMKIAIGAPTTRLSGMDTECHHRGGPFSTCADGLSTIAQLPRWIIRRGASCKHIRQQIQHQRRFAESSWLHYGQSS